MEELLRHPIVATVLAGLALAILVYIARKVGSLSKVPDQVDALDRRLTAHLAQEESDNRKHAEAVEGVHERIDAILLHLTGHKPERG